MCKPFDRTCCTVLCEVQKEEGYKKGKVVSMLNTVPRHDVWESGGIAPHILNLGTGWR